MGNIYEPPKSDLGMQGEKKGSPVKAIILGLTVDIGGTILFGIIFGIVYGVYLGSNGMNAVEIGEALQKIEPLSLTGIITSGIGLIFSGLGGYTCARIANHNEFNYSAILGGIVCLFGFAMGAGRYSIVEIIIMSIITFLVVIGGAYMHVKSKMGSGNETIK